MFPKESGIYCFENLLDGKKYIGQSQDLDCRMRRHFRDLEKGKDCVKVLQNAWSKYGRDSFLFFIIEKCKIDDLDRLEIFYIRDWHTHVSEWGYNIALGGDVPMRGRKHSEATKKKLSENAHPLKGEANPFYNRKHTQESLQLIIDHHVDFSGEKNPMFGRNHTQATKELMSENYNHDRKPRGPHSDEAKKNIGDGRRGKLHSQKTKDEMSKTRTGTKHRNSTSQYIGVCYDKSQDNWMAHIRFNKKTIQIGRFRTEIDAAKAYNAKAIELYGDKAKLNIIPEEKEV